jgi:hypothetical protein
MKHDGGRGALCIGSQPPSAAPPAPLLDAALARYDFAERHQLVAPAEPAAVYAALRRLDLSRSRVIRWLFLLRGLPALFTRARRRGPPLHLTMDSLLRSGFVLLADDAPREMVLGLAGRFWTPSGGRVLLTAAEFQSFEQPGYAKVAWNFTLAPAGGGRTLLSTETRVLCYGATARRCFRIYWLLIRPFSGWIRMEMLRAAGCQAQTAQPGGS